LAGKHAPDADGQVTVDLDGVLVIAQAGRIKSLRAGINAAQIEAMRRWRA